MSAAPPAPDGKVKQWLMERVGHADAPLGQMWVSEIAQLFIDGEWDESDIVKSQGGREGAKEVWAKILGVAAGKMGKPEPSVIAHAKALRSLLTLPPLYSLEVPGDVFITPPRVTLDVEPPYVPISSKTLRGKGEGGAYSRPGGAERRRNRGYELSRCDCSSSTVCTLSRYAVGHEGVSVRVHGRGLRVLAAYG